MGLLESLDRQEQVVMGRLQQEQQEEEDEEEDEEQQDTLPGRGTALGRTALVLRELVKKLQFVEKKARSQTKKLACYKQTACIKEMRIRELQQQLASSRS